MRKKVYLVDCLRKNNKDNDISRILGYRIKQKRRRCASVFSFMNIGILDEKIDLIHFDSDLFLILIVLK